MWLRRNDIKDEASDTCSWLLAHPSYLTWLDDEGCEQAAGCELSSRMSSRKGGCGAV